MDVPGNSRARSGAERRSAVQVARDSSDMRGGEALASAVDSDLLAAHRAALRRAAARARPERTQERAALADRIDRNLHYFGFSSVAGSLNVRRPGWLEDEYLDPHVRLDVVVAHEGDHLAAGQLLDAAHEVSRIVI
jgi:hypothetical protein